MNRINMYRYDETANQRRLVGWYDYDAADQVALEAKDWDGNNHVGRSSRLQTTRQELLRTSGGRWVLHTDARNEFNGSDDHEFISNAQAHEWLLTNGHDRLAAEWGFGPVADEQPDLATLAETYWQAEKAVRDAVVAQVGDGPGKMSEAEAARIVGRDRGTVRRWLGK